MNTNTNPEWRSRLEQAAKQFQTRFLPKLRKAQSEYGPKVQQAVSQTVDTLGQIDSKLEGTKYGDRYVTLKQEVNSAKASYANTKTKIKMGYVDTAAQGSAEPHPQAAKVGETVAKTELSLRQRLKELLQAAADRL